MNILKTFREQYYTAMLPEVTIDGVQYKVGNLTFPNGKEFVLGIMDIPFSQNYVFQITKTVTDSQPVGEVKKLSLDCDNKFKVFKYNPLKKAYAFVIIRPPEDESLSKEEINWLWDLL